MLGVPAPLIEVHGAVSEEVALAMAEGALQHSTADVAVALTGIAGPSGGSATKPVGLVYIAVAVKGKQAQCTKNMFGGSRAEIRMAAVERVLHMLQAL